jgi:hypothetical protein
MPTHDATQVGADTQTRTRTRTQRSAAQLHTRRSAMQMHTHAHAHTRAHDAMQAAVEWYAQETDRLKAEVRDPTLANEGLSYIFSRRSSLCDTGRQAGRQTDRQTDSETQRQHKYIHAQVRDLKARLALAKEELSTRDAELQALCPEAGRDAELFHERGRAERLRALHAAQVASLSSRLEATLTAANASMAEADALVRGKDASLAVWQARAEAATAKMEAARLEATTKTEAAVRQAASQMEAAVRHAAIQVEAARREAAGTLLAADAARREAASQVEAARAQADAAADTEAALRDANAQLSAQLADTQGVAMEMHGLLHDGGTKLAELEASLVVAQQKGREWESEVTYMQRLARQRSHNNQGSPRPGAMTVHGKAGSPGGRHSAAVYAVAPECDG